MGISQMIQSADSTPIFKTNPKTETKILTQLVETLKPNKSKFHIPKDLVACLDTNGQQKLKDLASSIIVSENKKDYPHLGASYFLFEFISQLNNYIKTQSLANGPNLQGKIHLIELWHPLQDSLEDFFSSLENLKPIIDEKNKNGQELGRDEYREIQNISLIFEIFGDFLTKNWSDYTQIKGKIGEFHVQKILEQQNLLYFPISIGDEDFHKIMTQLDAMGIDFVVDNGKIYLIDIKVGDKDKLKKESENIIFDGKNFSAKDSTISSQLQDPKISKLGYKISDPSNPKDIQESLETLIGGKIEGKIKKIYIYIDEKDFDLMGFHEKEKFLTNIKEILSQANNIGVKLNMNISNKPGKKIRLLRTKK